MLNPKAIRTKGQLNKVKKGGSSEGGFPKTDYTQSFNEFIGITGEEVKQADKDKNKDIIKFDNPLGGYKSPFAKQTNKGYTFDSEEAAVPQLDMRPLGGPAPIEDTSYLLTPTGKKEKAIARANAENIKEEDIAREEKRFAKSAINTNKVASKAHSDFADYIESISADMDAAAAAEVEEKTTKLSSVKVSGMGSYIVDYTDEDVYEDEKKKIKKALSSNGSLSKYSDSEITNIAKTNWVDNRKKELMSDKVTEYLRSTSNIDDVTKSLINKYNVATKKKTEYEVARLTIANEGIYNTLNTTKKQISDLKSKLKPEDYNFTSQAEVDEQNSYIDKINKLSASYNDLYKTADYNMSKINKSSNEADNVAFEYDMLKRNYSGWYNTNSTELSRNLNASPAFNVGNRIAGATIDFVQSENFQKLYNTTAGFALGLVASPFIVAGASENTVSDYLSYLKDKADTNLESNYAKVSKDTFASLPNFLYKTQDLLISQAPTLAVLGLTGGASGATNTFEKMLIDAVKLGGTGTKVLAAAGAGEKYLSMYDEIKNGIINEDGTKTYPSYNALQMISAPLLHGYAEGVSDNVLGAIMHGSGRVLKAAAKTEGDLLKPIIKSQALNILKQMPKAFATTQAEEQAAEQFTNLVQNFNDKVILGKDVSLFENTGTVFKDTFVMASLFGAAPHIAGAAVSSILPSDKNSKLIANAEEMKKLLSLSQDPNITDTEKQVYQKKIDKLAKNSSDIVNKMISKLDDLPDDGYKTITGLASQLASLRNEANDINSSNSNNKTEALSVLKEEYVYAKSKLDGITNAISNFDDITDSLSSKSKTKIYDAIIKAFNAPTINRAALNSKIESIYDEAGLLKEYKEALLDPNGRVSKLIDRDIARTKSAIKSMEFNADVKVFNTQKEAYEYFSKDIDPNSENAKADLNIAEISAMASGRFVEGKNGANDTIYINRESMLRAGVFTTGQHEFLHKVLAKAISNNPNLAIHLGNSLWKAIDQHLDGMADDTKLGDRLNKYQTLYKNGKITFSEYMEEVLPIFSEELTKGNITLKESRNIIQIIKDIIYKALGLNNASDMDALVKLDTGDDVINFIKDFNKGFAKGDFSEAIKKLAKEGEFKKVDLMDMDLANNERFNRVHNEPITLSSKEISAIDRAKANKYFSSASKFSIDYSSPNLSFEEKMAELQALVDDYEIDEDEYQAEKSNLEMKERMRKKREASGVVVEKPIVKVQDPLKEAEAIVKDNKAAVASEKVQSIYDEKGVDGAFDIIKLFKPITARIVDKRRDAPGFDKELLTDEIETGKGGIIDLIRTYKPESGVPLAAYINKQLPLRAIEASRRLLGETFAKDVDEQKGLAATETADEIVTAQLPEKPQYANAIEANVLEQPVIDNIKSKLLSTIRTLKTRIDEGVSMNRTVTPIITEIMAEMGSQADIDLKTAMGGKKDNELRKWLLKNKRYILENMTTTWLMGKGKANKVEGGIPQAIQKRVDGKWLSYPDWVGKKIDRESVSTDLAGRTAGHELVRRLPNAYNNVSNEDFLSQVLEPSGNPIRGRKESLAKAIAEEIAFDLIKADFAEEGELYDAFVANQTRLGVDTTIALIPELNKQAERGNVKYSLDFDQFSSILANSEDIANGLIANNFSKKSIQEAILEYAKIDISDSDANAISRRLIRSTFDKNDEISSITKGLFTKKNINLISEELNKLNDKNLSPNEIVSIVNSISAGKLKLGTLRDADGNISPLGTKLINTFAEKIKQTKDADRDNEIANFINLTNAAFRNAYNSNKGGKYISNAAYMQKVFGSNTELGKLASNWGSVSKTGADGKITTHITLNGKIYKPYEFDVTLAESKKNTLNNLDKLDKQSNTHREAYYNALQTLKNNNDIETALAVISDQRSDLKSSMSLLAEFAGYENGVFDSNNIVWEHRPTRNEIAIESIKFLQGSVSDIQFKRFLNSAKVFAVSNEFNAELNKIARANELITGNSYDVVSKKLDKEILDRNGNPINTNKTGKLSLDTDFNKIIEDVYGIDAKETLSAITARKLGYNKGKFRFFIPPSAEDFVGLLYDFMGKGAKGDEHAKFFQDNLVRPYIEGVQRIDVVRNNIREGYKALKNKYPNESKKIKEAIDGTTFTYDQAIRVYLWKTNGVEIPGLSNKEINKLASVVQRDTGMRAFADELSAASGQINGWVEPGNYWNARSIVSDLHDITEKAGRRNILSEFIENSNEIFSEANLNKIESILGSKYRSALEESLSVMKNGGLGSPGDNISKAWTNWIANANGAIMFLNVRSTILQTIAATNYLNWKENNPIAAAKAFANQPQYWKDFAKIFNSPKLKERRSGLKSDVNEAELANAVNNSQDKARAALSYILKLGYTPTQIADSFAIAIGGATYYRNKFNAYVKAGMSEADAEIAAWDDFDNATEETQQSSDPMRLSQQQRSAAGRLILAFANAPMQYNRIMKKAFRDLKNGRGDTKTNLSKILYYGAVQNIMFSAIQSGLFYLLFDDEEEEDKDKATKKSEKNKDKLLDTVNSMADTILRGSGIAGAVVSTAKNVYMKYKEEDAKARGGDQLKTFVAAAGISPPLGSKVSKAYSAYRTGKFEKDVIDKQGWGVTLDGKFSLSPRYEQAGKAITAATNLPADYIVDKINSVQEILDSRNKTWQKIAIGLGWKPFEVGAINEEREAIKEIGKENRKQEGLLKRKATYAKKREDKERELDSIANLPEDQYQAWKAAELEKYNKKQEEKEQKKERELDSIANLPEDQYQAWKAEQIKKEELKALKRKIRAQYRSK